MKKITLFLVALASCLLWLSGAVHAGQGAGSNCATPDTNNPITTCFFDLTNSPSSTQTPASAVLNGGLFRVPAYDGDLGHGTIVGTGVFQPFVRIQEPGNGNKVSNGIESGFNTDGRPGVGQDFTVLDNHDKGDSNWNHSIKLGDVSKVTVCDGGGSTGSNCKNYYEFLLDVNEQGNVPNSGISLDEFKVFTSKTSGAITSYTGFEDNTGAGNGRSQFALGGDAVLKYDMDAGAGEQPTGSTGGDASILMDYSNFSGSGNGVDLQALVPEENFKGVGADEFVYLYSKFGWTSTQCQVSGNTPSPCKKPDGTTGMGTSVGGATTKAGSLNFQADAGFEEWSFRKAVTPGTTPLPGTLVLFATGLALVGLRRKSAAA